MPFYNSPHAPVSIGHPQAIGYCDRCGARWLLENLQWQFFWAGNQLQNSKFRVCPPCLDIPNEQLRPIIIGPDPIPPKDPRPGYAATQMYQNEAPNPPVPSNNPLGWGEGAYSLGGFSEGAFPTDTVE